MLLLHTPFLRGYPPFSNSGLLRMKHITIYFWLNEHLVFFLPKTLANVDILPYLSIRNSGRIILFHA